jgi:hypothetical protein
MNTPHDLESPENPKQLKRSSKTFAQLIAQMKPALDKLPKDQALPMLPPDEAAFEEVKDYVTGLGLKITEGCAAMLAIGDQLLERRHLYVGRMGLYKNTPTLSFLCRYPIRGRHRSSCVCLPCELIPTSIVSRTMPFAEIHTISSPRTE